MRNLLETQLPRYSSKETALTPVAPVSMERITTRTNARQFESFVQSINHCSSLLDARRLKNDIVGEIRRTRLLLANHEREDWIDGEKTEDVVAFLDRLYTAKRKVEERIVILGGEDDSSVCCVYSSFICTSDNFFTETNNSRGRAKVGYYSSRHPSES